MSLVLQSRIRASRLPRGSRLANPSLPRRRIHPSETNNPQRHARPWASIAPKIPLRPTSGRRRTYSFYLAAFRVGDLVTRTVATILMIFGGLNYEATSKDDEDKVWKCAVDDGSVDPNRRDNNRHKRCPGMTADRRDSGSTFGIERSAQSKRTFR